MGNPSTHRPASISCGESFGRPQGNPLLNALGDLPLNPTDPRMDPRLHPNVQLVPDACLLNTPPNASVPAAPASLLRGTVIQPAAKVLAGGNYLSLPVHLLRGRPGFSRNRKVSWESQSMRVPDSAAAILPGMERHGEWNSGRSPWPSGNALDGRSVPKGNVLVSVDWTTTGDVVAARLVSSVALLLVTGLYFSNASDGGLVQARAAQDRLSPLRIRS